MPEEYKLEAVRNVTDILSRTFSSQFVFPALGHNDPPPSRKLVDMWMQWLPSDALTTFETGMLIKKDIISYISSKYILKILIIIFQHQHFKQSPNLKYLSIR